MPMAQVGSALLFVLVAYAESAALVVIVFFFRRWLHRGCVYGRDQ
jgi:hypothetical protein